MDIKDVISIVEALDATQHRKIPKYSKTEIKSLQNILGGLPLGEDRAKLAQLLEVSMGE